LKSLSKIGAQADEYADLASHESSYRPLSRILPLGPGSRAAPPRALFSPHTFPARLTSPSVEDELSLNAPPTPRSPSFLLDAERLCPAAPADQLRATAPLRGPEQSPFASKHAEETLRSP